MYGERRECCDARTGGSGDGQPTGGCDGFWGVVVVVEGIGERGVA